MKHPLWHGLAAVLVVSCLCVDSQADTRPPELRMQLPQASIEMQARFSYFGFAVYDANMWVPPGFSLAGFDRHAFALQLTYQRDFEGVAIAQRSVQEMRRQPGLSEQRLQLWERYMRDAFPDVRKGDRLTGIHNPGSGAQFLLNGRPIASIPDPEFAGRFFGIWLSPQSSDARLRDAVLAQTGNR